jgi:monovalent cation:H+ antiporter, CPA1 family
LNELLQTIFGVSALLAFAVLMFPLARRLQFPFTIMLAFAGILLGSVTLAVADLQLPIISGFIAALDSVEITLDLVMYVFLPTLLFESALGIDIRRLSDDIAPILLLSIFGVLIVTLTVGLALNTVVSYGLVTCLLLGTIVSSTDPIAVVSIFKNVSAPKRLTMLVEGESLFNDAAAIVLFSLLTGILLGTQEANLTASIIAFVKVFLGGIAVGYVLARTYCWIFSWLGDIPIAKNTLSISLPYICMIIGESYFQVSGVMAAVTAGLVVASVGRAALPPSNWKTLLEIWGQLGFIANSMVFLLMGLAVPAILIGMGQTQLIQLLGLALVVLVARIIIMFGFLPLMSKLNFCAHVSSPYRVVMCWGGLLGAVPLALAMAIMNDAQFPAELQAFIGILATSYVLFTLFVNGTTLPILIGILKLNRLSRADTLIKQRALANAHSMIQNQAEALSIYSEADKKFINSALNNIEQQHENDAVEIRELATLSDDMSDEEWIIFGLETMVQHERQIYSRQLEQQTVDASTARTLFAATQDLADSLKQSGSGGYIKTTTQALQFGWQIKLASLMQRQLNYSEPLAKLLTQRFEELSSMTLALRELTQKPPAGLSDMLSRKTQAEVEHLVSERHDQVSRELNEVVRAYPDYAEQVERRMFLMAINRIEKSTYLKLGQESLINNEIMDNILRELENKEDITSKKIYLDLGLDLTNLILAVPFFAELSTAVREDIAALLQPRFTYPREKIISTGEPGDAMYFISRGAVTIMIADREIELGKGDFFGEMALINDQPRNANVIADTYCDLLLLPKKDFQFLMSKNKHLKTVVHQEMLKRAADNSSTVNTDDTASNSGSPQEGR